MYLERLHRNSSSVLELEDQRYAEGVFESLPSVEMGVDIPRVHLTRLATGKDSKLKLSEKEALIREGWDFKQVSESGKGELITNQRTGEIFEVMDVKKGRMQIRNIETNDPGVILANERTVPAHEYIYKISDNKRNSKKITVYDTIYKDRSMNTSEFLDSIVASIPVQCMDVFDEIQIHKRTGGQTGESKEPSMFSRGRVISLYLNEENYSTEDARQTFYHELWHAIVKHLKHGSAHPGKKWRQAMLADGNAVSEYAEKQRYAKENHHGEDEDRGEIEDIAEAGKFYFAADGAKTNATQPLRDVCSNRFTKLDEIMQDLEREKRAGFVGALKSRIFKPASALQK